MVWFSKSFYTVVKEENGIRFFNLQVDMRGVTEEAGIQYPTAGYFRFSKAESGMSDFGSGTVKQPKESN